MENPVTRHIPSTRHEEMALSSFQRALREESSSLIITHASQALSLPPLSNASPSSPLRQAVEDVLLIAEVKEGHYPSAITRYQARPRLHDDTTTTMTHCDAAYAYALYKMKQHDLCSAFLHSRFHVDRLEESDAYLCAGHVFAQLHYRCGRFHEAARLYERFRGISGIEQDDEFSANVLAILSQLDDLKQAEQWIKQKQLLHNAPTYELAYNAACVLIEAGNLKHASLLLQQALNLARQALHEDNALSATEMADELSAVECQQAYVMQLQQETTQAGVLYNEVLHKSSDSAVRAVASNNLLSLHSSETRIFDSLKRSNKAAHILAVEGEDKLSTRQKSALAYNRTLALMAAKQYTAAQQQLLLVNDLGLRGVLQVALKSAENNHKEDVCALLKQYLSKNGNSAQSLEAQLSLAQLEFNAGSVNEAQRIIKELRPQEHELRAVASIPPIFTHGLVSFQQRPGVLSTLAQLSLKLSSAEENVHAFDDALLAWERAAQTYELASEQYVAVMEQLAQWHLDHNRVEQASTLLKRAASLGGSQFKKGPVDGSKLAALARLVVITAKVDLEAAVTLASRLPAVADVDKVDVQCLIHAPAPELARRKRRDQDDKDQSSTLTATSQPTSKKARSKRKRKPRYPKYFDPTNPNNPPPDPQRWWPRWERTANSKKSKKVNAMRGAQGAGQGANVVAVSSPPPKPQIPQPTVQSATSKKAAMKRRGKKGK